MLCTQRKVVAEGFSSASETGTGPSSQRPLSVAEGAARA